MIFPLSFCFPSRQALHPKETSEQDTVVSRVCAAVFEGKPQSLTTVQYPNLLSNNTHQRKQVEMDYLM